MAQTADVITVDVKLKSEEGGTTVLIKKFGAGSDVNGKFKIGAYVGVEPLQELSVFLPHTQPEFNLTAFGEILTELVGMVRVVVKQEAVRLEQDFYEEFK